MNSTNLTDENKPSTVRLFRDNVLSDRQAAPAIVIGNDIPMELRKQPRWVNWKWVWSAPRGKWNKPPFQPCGTPASSTNSATWTTYEVAMQAHESTGMGIGYVLNGDGLVGLDLDDVRNPDTGEITAWARDVIDAAATYTEVSPSGTGVKLLLRCPLPIKHRTEYSRPDGAKLEVYSNSRYFTITGHRVPGTPAEINVRTHELAEILNTAEGWRCRRAGKGRHTPRDHIKQNAGPAPGDDFETARAALAVLDPDLGYNDWLRVGMALHSLDPSASMLTVFDQWSRGGQKYVEDEPAQKWRSFTADGGVTVSTLYRMADETGIAWRPPRALTQTSPPGTRRTKPLKPPLPPPISWKPFPTHVLPQRLSQFVTEIAGALGCDPSLVALPALSVLASCIGNSRTISLKRTWTEPCVIWSATIAPPSSLKSPAWSAACAPLQRRQQDHLARFREQLAEYERLLQMYEAECAEWKKTGRKRGEPLPEKPELPVCLRLITSDATVEALLRILAENPRGCLYGVDELAGWINGLNSYTSRGQE